MGGFRPGGGRKKGDRNIRNRQVASAYIATKQITPLEVMLENMLWAHTKAADLLADLLAKLGIDSVEDLKKNGIEVFKELLRLRMIAQECAKDAAPYIHPKLAALEVTGKDGGPIEHADASEAEFIRSRIAQLAARSGANEITVVPN